MKNVLFGSMIFFLLTLSAYVIFRIVDESKMKVKTVWQNSLVIETRAGSVEEAIDFILKEDSIIFTQDHVRYFGK